MKSLSPMLPHKLWIERYSKTCWQRFNSCRQRTLFHQWSCWPRKHRNPKCPKYTWSTESNSWTHSQKQRICSSTHTIQVYTPLRLQMFSGCCPHPISEVYYETHCSNVELLLKNKMMMSNDKRISKASHMMQSTPQSALLNKVVYFKYAEECTPSQSTSDSKNEVQDLKRQIADLQSQLTQSTQKDSWKAQTKQAAKPVTPKSVVKTVSLQPTVPLL